MADWANLLNPVTIGGLVFWIGVIFLFVSVLALTVIKAVPRKGVAVLLIVGVVMLLIGTGITGLTPVSGSQTPVVAGTSVSSYITYAGASGFQAGVTYNSQTNVLTVYAVFNTTADAWCVAASNTSLGKISTCDFLVIGVHSARADLQNVTAGFTDSVSSVYTFSSLGASPETYSFLGYTAATSTSTGQWQAYWSSGSNGGLKSSVNAPSVASNIVSSQVGIVAFGATTNYLHLSLAGENSTSFPTTAYSALQTYSSYPIGLSVSSSSPAGMTINFVPLGENS